MKQILILLLSIALLNGCSDTEQKRHKDQPAKNTNKVVTTSESANEKI